MDWKRRAILLGILFAGTVIYLAATHPGAPMDAVLGLALRHLVIFVGVLLILLFLLMPMCGAVVAKILPAEPNVTPALDASLPADLKPHDVAWRAAGLEPTPPLILDARPPFRIYPYVHAVHPVLATLTKTSSRNIVTGLLSEDGATGRLLETIRSPELDIYPIPKQVIRQVIPGATPDELLAHHLQAMAALDWTYAAVSRETAGLLLTRSYRLVRGLYVGRPFTNGARLWSRLVLRRMPNLGPLVERL